MTAHEFHQTYFSEFVTDSAYLLAHFPRFVVTKKTFETTTPRTPNATRRVLDVGAHWLHQSVLWRRDGYHVIAADVPDTLRRPDVQCLAEKNSIQLIAYPRLDTGSVFDAIPSHSIDVVLFCEIIEHITFNPVAFWSEIYRVMAPGARIVVTTPNYYWVRGRAWDIPRLIRREGGGLRVDDLLQTPTYGPHWKEYSLRELARYFSLLSPDFRIEKTLYIPDPRNRPPTPNLCDKVVRLVEKSHRVFRWGLHVEVSLPRKQTGITVKPSWG